MKRIVLDASAVMTVFDDRPGVEKVESWIELAGIGKLKLSMSVVNWGEVYYSIWRTYGKQAASVAIEEIAKLPVEIVDAGLEITRVAARFRAEFKLPYADCFAAALSFIRNAELATADADFDVVADHVALLKLP